MFEKRQPFNWKVPAIILASVTVLSGGVYMGIKSVEEVTKKEEIKPVISDVEEKEVFNLREDCEIWLNEVHPNGTINEDDSYMLGFVPVDLLDMSEEEIRTYLADAYPDKEIDTLTKSKITLVNKDINTSTDDTSQNTNQPDISKANKFTIEPNNGQVAIFTYDSSGIKSVAKQTNIPVDALPQVAQDEMKKGMIFNTIDEAYSGLEIFQ